MYLRHFVTKCFYQLIDIKNAYNHEKICFNLFGKVIFKLPSLYYRTDFVCRNENSKRFPQDVRTHKNLKNPY